MATHLTQEEIEDVIASYSAKLEPVKKIAGRYGRTRQSIYKILKTAGVASSARVNASCSACGKDIVRNRSDVRNKKNLFCNKACRDLWRKCKQPNSKYRKTWDRIARAKIGKYFAIKPEHIVHWIDGKHYNNAVNNLIVFASQADYFKFHNGDDGIRPVWDGEKAMGF